MKTVLLLMCMVLTHGRVLKTRELHLPVAQISKITAVDPAGIQIEWDHVKADVVGYRIKLWELPTSHMFHYEVENGQQVLVDLVNTPKFPINDDLPKNRPRVYTVPAQVKPMLIVRDIKLNTIYEARIQAFDNKEDGPLSGPMRIKHG